MSFRTVLILRVSKVCVLEYTTVHFLSLNAGSPCCARSTYQNVCQTGNRHVHGKSLSPLTCRRSATRGANLTSVPFDLQARKLFICTTVILLNFNVTLGSSLPSGAGPTLNAHFGVTSELQKPLPVAVFLIGYSRFNPFSRLSVTTSLLSFFDWLCILLEVPTISVAHSARGEGQAIYKRPYLHVVTYYISTNIHMYIRTISPGCQFSYILARDFVRFFCLPAVLFDFCS